MFASVYCIHLNIHSNDGQFYVLVAEQKQSWRAVKFYPVLYVLVMKSSVKCEHILWTQEMDNL